MALLILFSPHEALLKFAISALFFQVEAAVTAARDAFLSWSSKSPQERSQIMNKLADLIEHDLEAFAQAESKDQGKGRIHPSLCLFPKEVIEKEALVKYQD